MNGLLAAMAVANPVITALLTVVVFLEKDKIKQRSEDLEAALKAGNQELVQTVAAQKENFENIATRLEALSQDSAKSTETFVGLSTALTESSAVSATALNGVTTGLEAHAKSVENLVTDLSNHVSTTAANAISDLAKRSEQTLQAISTNVKEVENTQEKSITAISSIVEQTLQGVTASVKAIEASQEKSITDIGSKTEQTLQELLRQTKMTEDAQNKSIEALAETSKITLGSVSDQIKKVEVAQIAVANSIKDLQETLKNTVSL